MNNNDLNGTYADFDSFDLDADDDGTYADFDLDTDDEGGCTHSEYEKNDRFQFEADGTFVCQDCMAEMK